jgi:hypothetical protein
MQLGRDNGWWIGDKKWRSLYLYSREVKELDVFLEFGGFFGNISFGGAAGESWR